jgi:hypothetical protein
MTMGLTTLEIDDGIFRENEPTHSEDGVDLTLIRWMLSLTPAERLQVLQQSVQSLLRLRDGKANR